MATPFNENPWQDSGYPQGPRYGNAYESTNNPPYGNAYESTSNPPYGNAYEQPIYASQPNNYMPATGYNNSWTTESNKIEYPPQPVYNIAPQSPPIQHNAYQYTGTPYGNAPQPSVQTVTPLPSHNSNKPTTSVSVGPEPWTGEVYHPPNRWNFWLRFILLLASIGHLGFAAGASPYSGEDVPFYTSACFYYLFAVAALSIIWAGINTFYHCYRKIAKKNASKKSITFLCDLLLTLLWGIGVIIEVTKFRCTDGGKFCAFYNVSIFFGFLAFAGYIVAMFCDVFSGCYNKKA